MVRPLCMAQQPLCRVRLAPVCTSSSRCSGAGVPTPDTRAVTHAHLGLQACTGGLCDPGILGQGCHGRSVRVGLALQALLLLCCSPGEL